MRRGAIVRRAITMNAQKTSKQLVIDTLKGQTDGRGVVGPWATHFCAGLSGVSLRDYTLNPRMLADCVLRYYEEFRPDAVCLSADTWVSAQAMGAAVAFPGEQQPMGGTGRPRVQSAADIDRIAPPDPESQGRYPIMLQAMRYLRDALGKDVFLVACFDQYPFSLACALLGIQQMMIKIADDRPMVEALMERCSQYAVAYALALAEAGADMLTGGDSPAG
jgi:uroporphyrinogen-III decarboxylase